MGLKVPVHTRSLSNGRRCRAPLSTELRHQLVSGHENLQSDGFMVDVDGKYFFGQLSKISTPFFQEKCRFTWNSKWFYKWMDRGFCYRKMAARYIYRPFILSRQPADKLWCVRARRIPYGRIFTLEFHLGFHLELQVILQVNGSRSFAKEKWSPGTFIDRI